MWEQWGADPSMPMWESPKKKYTGRIIFEVLLLMILRTKLFYSSKSCMLQKYNATSIWHTRCYTTINFLKYVNLDMNIEWIPLAPDGVLPEFSYPFLPLFPTFEFYFFWLRGKLTVLGTRKIAKLFSKNTQRSFLLYPYDDLFEDWSLMTTARL